MPVPALTFNSYRARSMVAKKPRLLTAERRDTFVCIAPNLSERDLGRFYTLSARDLKMPLEEAFYGFRVTRLDDPGGEPLALPRGVRPCTG